MEHRKYIEWIEDRRLKNEDKAQAVFMDAEKAIENQVNAHHLPYRKEKLTELRKLMYRTVYLEHDLRTELDKIDVLLERWNYYQNPEISRTEQEQHRSFIQWCECDPDTQAEYLDLQREHRIVELQIQQATAIREALLKTSPAWWGHNDFRLGSNLKFTEEEHLQHSLAAIKANRKKLGQIAYNCQKAADRRIYNKEHLAKAVHFRELWHQELMKEKAVKAELRQIRKSEAKSHWKEYFPAK